MARVSVDLQKMRNLRRRKLRGLTRGVLGADPGVPRLKKLAAWLDQQSTDLDGTGTGQTFTVAPASVAATGILTLTGQPLDTETVTLDTKVYTFQTTLTDADGNVAIGSSASVSLDNLIAAITLAARQVAATGVLTLTGQPLDTETVTVGGTTYTFQTSLVDSANNVLIGATASDSIDNLIAAISAGAGAGTLYGTGTVENADASAAAGAGDTMDLTAKTLGPGGNSVTTTETLTNGSYGAATLEGGFDRYAASMTDHPTVTATAGAGDTMDVTAETAGAAGNTIASTETLTNGSFGGATLSGGLDGEGLEIASHGHVSGDGPFLASNSGGALPAGLDATTLYWAGLLDASHIRLHRTWAEAAAGTNPVDITDAGTGTHTLTPATTEAALAEHLRQGVSPATLRDATDVDDLI